MSELRARGRCLCGAITIRLYGELRDVFDCHCHRCRRFTGHHMAATAANVSETEIDDDDGNLRWFFPVPEAAYGFCSACGSSLFWKSGLTEERISICAGVLDPPTGLKTMQAWWVSEASDYHERPNITEFSTE